MNAIVSVCVNAIVSCGNATVAGFAGGGGNFSGIPEVTVEAGRKVVVCFVDAAVEVGGVV